MSVSENPITNHNVAATSQVTSLPEGLWYRALHPEEVDQGDPFVLVSPEPDSTRFLFYLYVTSAGDTTGGWAFTVYGAHELHKWHKIVRVLRTEEGKACWAPAVVYVPEIDRPYVMLYSQGAGSGDLAHRNQRLFRADALTPEGPFVPSGHALTPELDFAIDPDLFELEDGTWRIICATDFDMPSDFESERVVGTGLAIGRLNRDLTEWIEPLSEMARASADWHVYHPERNDQHWKPWFEQGRGVRWYCMEGPASFDRDTVIYSGGNYGSYYAMGVLHRQPDGSWSDRSIEPSEALVHPVPTAGLFGTGHGMVFTHPDDGQRYLVFHAKYGSSDAVRQCTMAPLFRNKDGVLSCPPVPSSVID
jgi:hypothetical protein